MPWWIIFVLPEWSRDVGPNIVWYLSPTGLSLIDKISLGDNLKLPAGITGKVGIGGGGGAVVGTK